MNRLTLVLAALISTAYAEFDANILAQLPVPPKPPVAPTQAPAPIDPNNPRTQPAPRQQETVPDAASIPAGLESLVPGFTRNTPPAVQITVDTAELVGPTPTAQEKESPKISIDPATHAVTAASRPTTDAPKATQAASANKSKSAGSHASADASQDSQSGDEDSLDQSKLKSISGNGAGKAAPAAMVAAAVVVAAGFF